MPMEASLHQSSVGFDVKVTCVLAISAWDVHHFSFKTLVRIDHSLRLLLSSLNRLL